MAHYHQELEKPSHIATGPWIKVANVNNLRDLGGYKITPPLHLPARKSVRRHFAYRSAAPAAFDHFVETDKSSLPSLDSLPLGSIFDLRSESEVKKATAYTHPTASRVHVPAFPGDASPEVLAFRYSAYLTEDVKAAFVTDYRETLACAADAFRIIFTHVRDHPDKPWLVHCTGGKDRAGLVSAFVLKLAGVSDETIAGEYHLTESGFPPEMREVALHYLTANAKKGLMGSRWAALAGGIKDDNTPEDPKAVREALERMISARPESMLATLQMIETDFAGVTGYLTTHCGFSAEDVRTIQNHLTSDEEPSP